jgi:hypothetical protein
LTKKSVNSLNSLKRRSKKKKRIQELKLKRRHFGNDFYSKGLRRSGRIRITKKISSSGSSSSSNSGSDDDNGKEVDEDGLKSYDLIFPSIKENKFNADDLKLALSQSKDGKELENKFRKLKLKFTKFDVPNVNVQEPIFEILNKTGCAPQPRGIVCKRFGSNIYDGEFEK